MIPEAQDVQNRRAEDHRIARTANMVAELSVKLDKHIRDEAPVMRQVKDDLEANTLLTKKISEETSAILAFWASAEAGFKVLKWIGVVAKWVTVVSTAVGVLYGVWHFITGGGVLPPNGKV